MGVALSRVGVIPFGAGLFDAFSAKLAQNLRFYTLASLLICDYKVQESRSPNGLEISVAGKAAGHTLFRREHGRHGAPI
jgi:hypothetical protein